MGLASTQQWLLLGPGLLQSHTRSWGRGEAAETGITAWGRRRALSWWWELWVPVQLGTDMLCDLR